MVYDIITNLPQAWYVFCSNDWTNYVRERPLDSQGGGLVFFLKKIFWPWFWPKKYLEQNILAPSIEKKSLPSIHEKKMSALYP